MTTRLALFALAAALLIPTLASADRPSRHHVRYVGVSVFHLQQRIDNQYARIHAGLADGSITHGESRSLLRAERRIERRLHSRYLRPAQLAHIERMIDRQSAKIARAVYNGRFRVHPHDHHPRDHRLERRRYRVERHGYR